MLKLWKKMNKGEIYNYLELIPVYTEEEGKFSMCVHYISAGLPDHNNRYMYTNVCVETDHKYFENIPKKPLKLIL